MFKTFCNVGEVWRATSPKLNWILGHNQTKILWNITKGGLDWNWIGQHGKSCAEKSANYQKVNLFYNSIQKGVKIFSLQSTGKVFCHWQWGQSYNIIQSHQKNLLSRDPFIFILTARDIDSLATCYYCSTTEKLLLLWKFRVPHFKQKNLYCFFLDFERNSICTMDSKK